MAETDACADWDSSLKSGSLRLSEKITIKLESEQGKISGTWRSSTHSSSQ